MTTDHCGNIEANVNVETAAYPQVIIIVARLVKSSKKNAKPLRNYFGSTSHWQGAA